MPPQGKKSTTFSEWSTKSPPLFPSTRIPIRQSRAPATTVTVAQHVARFGREDELPVRKSFPLALPRRCRRFQRRAFARTRWPSARRRPTGDDHHHDTGEQEFIGERGLTHWEIDLASSEHQRRWQAEGYVRLDQDQGCRSPILQPGLQEGRCRPEQAVRQHFFSRRDFPGNNESRKLNKILSAVPVSSPPKSSSESSPSSRTPRSTRSPRGSSTDSATLSTARTPRSSPTASTPSCVTTSSASRRSALTVVSATTGASASAASTPRPLVAVAGPSVSPRRRVVKGYDGYGIGWIGVTAGFSIFLSILRGLLFPA